jgi:hypothetical protein
MRVGASGLVPHVEIRPVYGMDYGIKHVGSVGRGPAGRAGRQRGARGSGDAEHHGVGHCRRRRLKPEPRSTTVRSSGRSNERASAAVRGWVSFGTELSISKARLAFEHCCVGVAAARWVHRGPMGTALRGRMCTLRVDRGRAGGGSAPIAWRHNLPRRTTGSGASLSTDLPRPRTYRHAPVAPIWSDAVDVDSFRNRRALRNLTSRPLLLLRYGPSSSRYSVGMVTTGKPSSS